MANRLRNKASRTKSKSSFVYKRRDDTKVKERAQQTGGRFDTPWKNGVEVFRAKVGDNLIRILPPTWDEPEYFAYDVWVHAYIGPDNSTYLCLNKMKDKNCPVCNAYFEAKQAGEEDEAKQLQAKKQAVCWVINRDEDPETPMLYPMSWTMDRDIASLVYNNRTGKATMIDDPNDGFDLTIKRSGQGLKTRYHGLMIDRDPSPINEDPKVQDAILEYIEANPIPSMLNYHDAKHLDKVLLGTNAEKDDIDEDDEDDVKVKKSKRHRDEEDEDGEESERPKSKNKRQAREEDDDEEEEETTKRKKRARDEEEEEEDEEEETDARKKPVRTRSRKDEDEDEEDDDDERPHSRGSKGRVSSVKKRDDDDDEDEEDDADEEDEDEPKKSRRGNDDDDDDDDDDDRPKRRRR